MTRLASYYEPELIVETRRSPVVFEIEDGGCWRCVSHATHPASGRPYFYRLGRTTRIGSHLFHLENPDVDCRYVRTDCGNVWCINPAHAKPSGGGCRPKFTEKQADRIRFLAIERGWDRGDLAYMYNTNLVTIGHVINSKGAYAQPGPR